MLLLAALCLGWTAFGSFDGLLPTSRGAVTPPSCGAIYRSFAQCLLALGDSLVETQKNDESQDVDAVCSSWNAFHGCADAALAGCPGDAAAVWASLRREARKTEFSGNLYDVCASRNTPTPSPAPAAPQSPPTSARANQETLTGGSQTRGSALGPAPLLLCSLLPLLVRL